jgi:hypothetical protein
MVRRYILAALCEMFSVTLILADGWVEEDPLYGFSLTRFDSSGFVPVGTPKKSVYAAPVDEEEALHHRIVDVCRTVRNRIFEWMRRSAMRRVEACIEFHGGHFEHLLQTHFFSYNSQIKYFRTHVNMDTFFLFGM